MPMIRWYRHSPNKKAGPKAGFFLQLTASELLLLARYCVFSCAGSRIGRAFSSIFSSIDSTSGSVFSGVNGASRGAFGRVSRTSSSIRSTLGGVSGAGSSVFSRAGGTSGRILSGIHGALSSINGTFRRLGSRCSRGSNGFFFLAAAGKRNSQQSGEEERVFHMFPLRELTKLFGSLRQPTKKFYQVWRNFLDKPCIVSVFCTDLQKHNTCTEICPGEYRYNPSTVADAAGSV
jgi:hypothetical protein